MKPENIKGILLDYGGTIDTNGVHWGEVLWQGYQRAAVPVSKDAFRKAYSHGERTLALKPLIEQTHFFEDVLRIKIGEQLSFLHDEQQLAAGDYSTYQNEITRYCHDFALAAVNSAIPVLEYLTEKYPVVLVSNFYGNINAVLNNYRLNHFFKSVVESAVVQVRKPDPQIFSLGVAALGLPAANVMVIGDSYTKDIAPGKSAGCMTIWLNKAGWGDDPPQTDAADYVIEDFAELKNIL